MHILRGRLKYPHNLAVHPTGVTLRFTPVGDFSVSRQSMKTHSPKTLASIERLRKLKDKLPSLGNQIMHAGNKTMYPMDMVIIGIVKRCLSISTALESLVLNWNMTCARAVLRMQLDTVLRFSAFWLSDDPQRTARDVISGKQINKMRDRDGQKMTDSYLARKLGEHFDWIPQVYKYTSGYIHFSERQLFDPIWDLNDEERVARFVINEFDHKFPEHSWVELVDCAANCLLIVKTLLDGYRQSKAAAANQETDPTS